MKTLFLKVNDKKHLFLIWKIEIVTNSDTLKSNTSGGQDISSVNSFPVSVHEKELFCKIKPNEFYVFGFKNQACDRLSFTIKVGSRS